MSSAAGFDDIVFRYEQNGTTVCMLIQVKHKQDGSKKICVGDLLTKSGELNLVKHFAAFLEIQGNEEFKDKIKDFFIVINVDFDYESLASKGITVEKIETQDEFLNIGDSAKYKLRDLRNNIAQYLKQRMSAEDREVSDEEIKGFLNELVFVVNLPSDVELEKLIRNEINDDLARRFKYFGDNDSVLNALSTMISNWMKDKRGRFLTPEEGKEFFQKVELWASTVSEIRQGVERIEGKVDEIGEVLNNQQARKEPIWFNMKYPVKTFTGRRSELQKIYKELHKTTNEQAEVSQIVVISGLGGIGKSELARKYAYEYRKDYDGNVIWINAETQKDLEGSFRGLAEELKKRLTEGSKISITEEGIKSTIKDVYRYFRNVESLFIFDNAKGYRDVNKFLPLSFPDCKKPYVLITSHDTKWEVEGVEYEEGRIEVIRLGVLDETEAWEFVKKALDIKDNLQDEKIRELTEELQYLPLALGQAVVYIYNKNEELAPYEKFEISDYLKKYKQQAEKLFEETESLLKKWLYDEEEENEGEYSKRVRYTKTILTTWNVTIDAIKQKECGPEALDILEVMVYLAPDRIRVKEIFLKLIYDKAKLCNIFGLLSEYPVIDLKEKEASVYIPAELKLQIEEIFLKLLVNSEKRMWEAVKLLNRYSMIDLEGGVANIHRLVQKVTELKLKKEGREEEVLRKTIKLINADYIFDDSIVASVWGYASKYDELIDNFYFNFTYGIQKCTPLHSLAKSGDYEAVKRIIRVKLRDCEQI
ncbi:NB-ARC domain-containing protein [Wolbachia endosymbiont (group A) of Hylaeus communis]|nr:NB-ARC domain-containing protein [Wolbachia endosymbiont (group A) of Hylaeus communis]